ncbi:hypothetical protein [Cupriavidus alkaliphilus]|uniref:hypothetical protein n=1 Tax=Cupriavidus alkaliphilus TaxID=942866 RepID=UPI00339D6755
MATERRLGARRYEGLTDGWVVERLEHWGAAQRHGWTSGAGYGQSCLTLPEVRSGRPHGFVPELEGHGEATDAAVRKQPRELQRIARLFYIRRLTGREIARELAISEARVTRLKQMLVRGVKFCLENHDARTPPAAILLRL